MDTHVKTRFSPSPTGLIHLGNARTALLSALFSAQQQGTFLLRIEDTDQERSKVDYVSALQRDLQWLNIQWQEGGDVGGDHGPYYQSQRSDIYQRYYQQLIEQGDAYPCFCSEQQLAVSRKLQRAAGQAPRYAGTCRHLLDAEIAAKRLEGIQPTLRFHMPENEIISFTDYVKGEQHFASDDIGDFIIRRADGSAAFMFCNAIDDAMMGVTHVMRGEDHLTNTPRQLAILKRLQLTAPQYGHISLILGSDGAPLSKRNGSRSIQDLREQGYLPLAVINYLARLGHQYEANDLLAYDQLAEQFKLTALSSSPARFDEDQLKFWQKQAVLQADEDSLWQWLPIAVQQRVGNGARTDFLHLVKNNCTFPHEAVQWISILFDEQINYSADAQAIIRQAHDDLFVVALQALEQYGTDFSVMADHIKIHLNIKGKALFQPLRMALTGQLHGPEMALITRLLGADKLQQRFHQAIKLRNL